MTRSPLLPRLARLALVSTLVSAGVLATVASPAAAHTPTVSATCSTLSVSLQSYVSSAESPRPNKVTVTIDSSTAASEWFGSSFARDFSLGDSARAHTWRVVVDAVDNGYDRTFDGTTTPCAPPAVKDASATLHTTPATCTAVGTLVLDTVVNATWSTPTATQGPAAYSVTATATRGHLFDDGTAKRVFTGSLPGALDAASPACASGPVVVVPPRTPPRPPVKVTPPKPAILLTSSRVETVDCETNVLTTTTTRTSTDWVLNAAGTAWVAGIPTETSTTSRRPLPPESCPEVGSVGGGGAGGGGVGGGQSPVVVSPASLSDAAVEAQEVDALAHAGNDILLAVGAAGALLLVGGLLLARRRRPVTEPDAG